MAKYEQSQAPLYWRCITLPSGIHGNVQRRDWQLVLNSQNIPYKIADFGNIEHIYVPPLYERIAIAQLAAYSRENKKKPVRKWPVYKNAWLVTLFLLPLAIFHGWRLGWLSAPAWLPPPDVWLGAGSLDSANVTIYHQYWRAVTALTMHADARHLAGNLLFGGIFLFLLARACGIGRALLYTVLAGALGNLLSIGLHTGNYRSIGFSTAIFASVGILAGITLARQRHMRAMLMPVAAACALLALLGTEGETTDYAAHIAGLVCGLLTGALAAAFAGWQPGQIFAGFLAMLLIAGAWFLAWQSL